jgi:serine/threonine protein phosphatase PrpC/serine/threonine protein kinase
MDGKRYFSRGIIIVLLVLVLAFIAIRNYDDAAVWPCFNIGGCLDATALIAGYAFGKKSVEYAHQKVVTMMDILRHGGAIQLSRAKRNKTNHEHKLLSSHTSTNNHNLLSNSKAIISTHDLHPPSSVITSNILDRNKDEYWTAKARIGRSLILPSSVSLASPAGTHSVLETTNSYQQQQDGDAEGAVSELEPYVGMILHVSSQLATASTTDVETMHPGDDNHKQQHQNDKQLSGVQYYELVERVYDELGLLDEHIIDFAYQPVIPRKQQLQRMVVEGEEAVEDVEARKINNTSAIPSVIPTLNSVDSSIFWLPYENSNHHENNNDEKKNYYYERVGNTAFAGGSHGEIWKARRRCDLFTNNKNHRQHHHSEEDGQEQQQHPCDDQQQLIMKRLKVEEGSAIMEAGLREVYFGQLLRPKVTQATSNLFTTYVDHFFKKAADRTELWIVFVDAGMSMRSFLYTPIISDDGFVVYQNSEFWRKLRVSVASDTTSTTSNNKAASSHDRSSPSSSLSTTTRTATTTTIMYKKGNLPYNKEQQKHDSSMENLNNSKNLLLSKVNNGRVVMKEVLRQLLTSAAYLHSLGIVHRDIKPSNIICKAATSNLTSKEDNNNKSFFYSDHFQRYEEPNSTIQCVLGDFSSAWDQVTDERLYSNGMSEKEQTVEYAPPEVLFSGTSGWIPFDPQYPQSYDSWSIGVVALEMLLGTPNVFSIDQRTTAILTHRFKNASTKEVQRALYLAALSQFCIYKPITSGSGSNIAPSASSGTQWPFSYGDPLHLTTSVKSSCSLQDFHDALRARDPLGVGFDSSADFLLELIWKLLAWNPSERISPTHALAHEYFITSVMKNSNVALVSTTQAANSKILVEDKYPIPTVYICPKCQRRFDNWNSCHQHANSRRHAKFCTYDTSSLPPCLSTHPMLPAHPTSGYCDIRGRRRTIEDFHSIRLQSTHQFYGVFDGHFGNLASKYAASKLYSELSSRLGNLHDIMDKYGSSWKSQVFELVSTSFEVLHRRFLSVAASSPGGVMDQSGTTATVLYVADDGIVVGNVGDSRAILSVGASYQGNTTVGVLQLTVDHIASDPSEQSRIESLGGFVSSDNKKDSIARVNGTLAVSRSIGDATLAPLLSRTPHVVAFTRKEVLQQCRSPPTASASSLDHIPTPESEFLCFIVVASDGLWDVISNQEAIDMVLEVIRHYITPENTTFRLEEGGGAFQEAAQRLTQEAYVRGSTDNIGVCVVAVTFPFASKEILP